MKKYWKKLIDTTESVNKDKKDDILKKKDEFLKEYLSQGYIRLTPYEALLIDTDVFILFYKELYDLYFKNSEIKSPVASEKDSNWMTKSDFCFINTRATGKEPQILGTFIDVIKLLPVLRVDAIHLAPYLECAFGNIYALNSLFHINDEVVNKEYENQGISGTEQLKILIDCVHLLKKVIGFDLEPHTSQFSNVVIDNPELFRWIKLSDDKETLYNSVSQDDMLLEDYQKDIIDEIVELRNSILAKHNIKKLESNIDKVLRETATGEVISELINKGYWTVPNHTWNGVGVPEFDKYNYSSNYPEFKYLDKDGEDQTEQAFGMLTPYKFYNNLMSNKIPKDEKLPEYNDKVIEYFAGIFLVIYKEFPFDFVRFDYVDHVFDSTLDESDDIPISDRMVPKLLKRVIGFMKEKLSYIGFMAERMDKDIDDYGSVGFDLVLGREILTPFENEYFEDCFALHDEIEKLNKRQKELKSVKIAIDTHDSGHPLFGGKTPAELYGSRGLLARLFWARFSNFSLYNRPKYEVIGNQDRTSGLYNANNISESIAWKNDKEHNTAYHNLEDIYKLIFSVFGNNNTVIDEYIINDEYLYWYITNRSIDYNTLLCYLCFKPNIQNDEKREVIINVSKKYISSNNKVFRLDFNTKKILEIELNDNKISFGKMKPFDYKLFWIKNEEN